MKSGVRKTLENIVKDVVLVGIGLVTAATVIGCKDQKPPVSTEPQPPAITQPYTVQGQWASLGYGKDGKLVVVDVDKIGDGLFNYLQQGNFDFTASNSLKIEPYSLVVGKGGSTGALMYVAIFDSNSRLVGTAQNVGKLEYLTINGSTAIMGWEANRNTRDLERKTDENKIMTAINTHLGVNKSQEGDITFGTDWMPGQYHSPESTDNGIVFRVYDLSTPSGTALPVTKSRSLINARNPELTTSVTDPIFTNGIFHIDLSYKMDNGKTNTFSGSFTLCNLLDTTKDVAEPLLPSPTK